MHILCLLQMGAIFTTYNIQEVSLPEFSSVPVYGLVSTMLISCYDKDDSESEKNWPQHALLRKVTPQSQPRTRESVSGSLHQFVS